MAATITDVSIRFANGMWDLSILGGSAEAVLTLSDGSTEKFQWFHDELTFTADEFMGKTMEQVRQMHYEKDVRYLRS
jgi:hypothetical protein